eukprot:5483957-Amphidinium_carterae.1
MLSMRRGDPAGMPVWEGLAILVGLRAWNTGEQSKVALRGDCLGVLKALMKMTSKSPNLNRVFPWTWQAG